MSFWKNKHVLVATLAAPVLAVVSYFGIGAIFGEKPMPAEAGQKLSTDRKTQLSLQQWPVWFEECGFRVDHQL